MSISSLLHAQQLAAMIQNARRAAQELEEHVKQDFEAVRVELEQTVAHFESEVSRLRQFFDTKVLAYIDKGLHPVQAVNQVANDEAAAAAEAAKPPAEVIAKP